MAKKYTVYNTDTSTAEATGKPWPVADGVSDPIGMPANLVLLEEINQAQPSYDQWTQKIVPSPVQYDLVAKTATTGWQVVNLTQEEIDNITPEHFVTSGGIKMATDIQSQAAFSNMMTLINEAGMSDTDMVSIKDCYENTHNLTVADYRSAAVAYGLHCYTLFHS